MSKKSLRLLWAVVGFTSFLSMVAIVSITKFANPDMTDTRLLINYWDRMLYVVALLTALTLSINQMYKLEDQE